MLWKIDGYLVIPHELLHVLAYRLIGKRCRYRVGEHFVEALDPRTWRERLFVLLFPLLITGGIALVFLLLWISIYLWARYPANPILYFQRAPFWHQSLWFVAVLLLLYSCSSVYDIVMAVRLLGQKLRHQPPDDTEKNENQWQTP